MERQIWHMKMWVDVGLIWFIKIDYGLIFHYLLQNGGIKANSLNLN